MLYHKNLPDHQLVDLLRESDKLAFTEIYDRYKAVLQAQALNKLGDLEEVRDVLQEVFTSLWNSREDLHDHTNLAGYLYTATRNRVFNVIAHRRVSNRYVVSLQEFINQSSCTTDFGVREKQVAAMIRKEIDELPPKMREVFLLSRDMHLSHREIASRLMLSEQTVSKQVSNALKILRERLGTLLFLIFLIRF